MKVDGCKLGQSGWERPAFWVRNYLKYRILNYVKIYKEVIRPTMTNGKVFHHTPMLPVMGNSPWCALEYAKPNKTTSVAVAMRTSSEAAGDKSDEYIFFPSGIDPSTHYCIDLDSQGNSWNVPGSTLIQEGIKIRLEEPLTSELVVIQSIKQK
jgi:hypothetical protein